MILRKREQPCMGIWKSSCVAPLVALRRAFILKRGHYDEQHVRKLYKYLLSKGYKELYYRENYELMG